MLDTKEMKPVFQRLYDKAVEGRSGKFSLEKNITPKYYSLWGYNRGYYFDVISDYLPNVILDEDGREEDLPLGWMYLWPCEYQSYLPIVDVAKGKMLSIGLGIGLLPEMLKEKLDNKVITELSIVEMNPDVVKLTWEYQKRPEMNLIMADGWDYIKETKTKYDTIFIDIDMPANIFLPKVCQRILNPGGIARGWHQEIYEDLRKDFRPLVYTTNKPCGRCGVIPHMNCYGGLCLHCAGDYESYIETFKEKGFDYKPGSI